MAKEKTIDVSEKKHKKEPYTSPVVSVYGTLENLTKMPGGSVRLEGLSGRDLNSAPPGPPPGHPLPPTPRG